MAHIIQPMQTPWQPDDWTRHLVHAVTDARDLLARLDLRAETLDADLDPDFPMRVPLPFVQRMRPGDPRDPLLRQVLPLRAEREEAQGYSRDPLCESGAVRATGLIQKYAGRALLIASPACAVHCRYCFRRHFPYEGHRQSRSFPALGEVERDPDIHEVILSGGDPLMLKDQPLRSLVQRLESIPHLRRVRIHTRLPVVIPQRVTRALLDTLEARRLPIVVVLHVNHPNEIDDDLARAMRSLRETGATLLNQSVLLAGVNDDADSLVALSERLHANGALPYYLHLPDRVQGTRHFDVNETHARTLAGALADRLPGYLVPRLAREIPGLGAKQVLPPL